MKLKYEQKENWLICQDEDAAISSMYTLDAFLPITEFNNYYKDVFDLLIKAVEDGIIAKFRIYQRNSDALHAQSSSLAISRKKSSEARLAHQPFTIYLHEHFDPTHIAELCQQIELRLNQAPPCNRSYLSETDMILTEHISFRHRLLDDRSDVSLKNEPSTSPAYSTLLEKIQNVVQPSEAMNRDHEKEDFIRGYYHTRYDVHHEKLYSKDIHRQFQGACELLDIEYSALLKEEGEEIWNQIINHQYRLKTRRFHTDRILHQRYEDTTEKAKKIIVLIQDAKAILNDIAKHPAQLSQKKIVEQEAYRPTYQYELEKYNHDTNFYLQLAKSNDLYILIKNWDFEIVEKKIQTKKESHKQQALIIYKPELIVYPRDQRKKIVLPGYQAFYYLYKAGAKSGIDLARIFAYGVYSNNNFDLSKESSRWLLKNALTTSEFLVDIRGEEILKLSITATKSRIISIGSNVSAVLLYYYQHHPEILWAEANLKSRDSTDLIEYIIAHPENLHQVSSSVLQAFFGLDERIKNQILADQNLSLQLGKKFTDEHILSKFFSLDDLPNSINPHIRFFIAQILYGNNSFIPLLSTKKLLELPYYIQLGLPGWMQQEVDKELSLRNNALEKAASTFCSQLPSHCYSPYDYIKTTYLSGDFSIVELLNKDALMWLASQPEVHCSLYQPIIEALLQLNEENTANRYQQAMEREAINPTPSQEKLPEAFIAWKQQKIIALKRQLENFSLTSEYHHGETHSELCKQLEYLGETHYVENEKKNYINTLKEKFFLLIERIQQGERSVEIFQSFAQIRLEVMSHNENWKYFSDRDKNNYLIFNQTSAMLSVIIPHGRHTSDISNDDRTENLLFGINPHSEQIIDSLRKIFFVYECLHMQDEFYDELQFLSDKPMDLPLDSSLFDEEYIRRLLLASVKNELAVYIEGIRKKIGYINTWDKRNIASFNNINRVFCGLGEKKSLDGLLADAFQKLLEEDTHYQRGSSLIVMPFIPKNYIRKYKNCYFLSGKILYYVDNKATNTVQIKNLNPLLNAVKNILPHTVEMHLLNKEVFEAALRSQYSIKSDEDNCALSHLCKLDLDSSMQNLLRSSYIYLATAQLDAADLKGIPNSYVLIKHVLWHVDDNGKLSKAKIDTQQYFSHSSQPTSFALHLRFDLSNHLVRTLITANSGHTPVFYCDSPAIKKYLEMRACGYHFPPLEHILIQNRLYQIVHEEFATLKVRNLIFSPNQLVSFCDEISLTYSDSREATVELLAEKTEKMLTSFKKFLCTYSNQRLLDQFLEKICTDAVLKSYFRQARVNLLEPNKKKLAASISAAILDLNYLAFTDTPAKNLLEDNKEVTSGIQYEFGLPEEILLNVFSFLSTQDRLSRAGLTCKTWHSLARDPLFDKDLYEKIKRKKENAIDSTLAISAPQVEGEYFAEKNEAPQDKKPNCLIS